MLFPRYACVKQNDQSDCGPACLATVALHYHCPIRLEQMRNLAGTDRVGTNLLGMIRAAERLGFQAKAVKGSFDVLPQAPLPAIAHVRNREGLLHFVVLHRVRANSVVVADPARGVETLSADEFKQMWTGYLVLLAPDRTGLRRVGREPMSPWRRLLGLLGGHLGLLAEAVFCAILMTVLGLSTSYFVQHLVDSVLVRGEARLLNALGFGMVLVVVFRTLFGMVRQILLNHIARKIDLGLISGYMRHVLALPMSFFDTRRVGEVLSRVQDATKVREAVSGTATTAAVDGVLVVLMVTVLWMQDTQLALVATAFVPVLLAGIMLHHPAANRRSRTAMENAAILSSHLIEDVSAVETIKTFGIERVRGDECEDKLVSTVLAQFGLQKLGLSMSSLSVGLTGLAGIVILWFGGHRVIDGALTIGQLMFFYTLLGYLLEPLASWRRSTSRCRTRSSPWTGCIRCSTWNWSNRRTTRRSRSAGSRRRSNCGTWTSSTAAGRRCWRARTCPSRPGRTVAVVGESGSGKSTLLKLLMGFYTPTGGRGAGGRRGPAGLRPGLVAEPDRPGVPGRVRLQRHTAGEHRPGPARRRDRGEVAAAAKAAGLEEFIASLPDRYETVVGERGANLSGGQRQRLAIARALLRQPDILIFDEATSHLDTATERAIQENLRTALAGKTVMLVAHRLSTIRSADLIYVLHQGRVAEHGTHRQLLARNGQVRRPVPRPVRRRRRATGGPQAGRGRPSTERLLAATARDRVVISTVTKLHSHSGTRRTRHEEPIMQTSHVRELKDCNRFVQTIQCEPPASSTPSRCCSSDWWQRRRCGPASPASISSSPPPAGSAPASAPKKVSVTRTEGSIAKVAEVFFTQGQEVREGEVLLRLDTEKLRNDLARKRRAIRAAEEELENGDRLAELQQRQGETAVAKLDAEIAQAAGGDKAGRGVRDAERRLVVAELLDASREEDAPGPAGEDASRVAGRTPEGDDSLPRTQRTAGEGQPAGRGGQGGGVAEGPPTGGGGQRRPRPGA